MKNNNQVVITTTLTTPNSNHKKIIHDTLQQDTLEDMTLNAFGGHISTDRLVTAQEIRVTKRRSKKTIIHITVLFTGKKMVDPRWAGESGKELARIVRKNLLTSIPDVVVNVSSEHRKLPVAKPAPSTKLLVYS